MQKAVERLLQEVVIWANQRDSVLGVSLVGSYARNEARPDSDVDLVLLCESPTALLKDAKWLSTFGKVVSNRHGDYGLVQSKHVLYEDGLKVEFGVTTSEWARTQPVDDFTRKIVTEGMQTLYDPENIFERLEDAICL